MSFRSIPIAGTLRFAELKPDMPNAFFSSRPSQALESMQRPRVNVLSRDIDDTPINANDRGADDIENDDWLFDDLMDTCMPLLNLPWIQTYQF